MYEGSPPFWVLLLLAIFLAGYIEAIKWLIVWLDDDDYGD
jgi:hypothetical protein